MSPRANVALIAAVCAAPFALASAVYWLGWGTGSAGNYGELVEPRLVSAAPLEALRGKWVLVTFDAAACDARCERKLFLVRQVRKAQGADQERIERLWVITDRRPPSAALVAATEGSRTAPASPSLLAQFPGTPQEHVYLVDPNGNLMMRFPPDPDPSKVIKDLQRLLKYSRIG